MVGPADPQADRQTDGHTNRQTEGLALLWRCLEVSNEQKFDKRDTPTEQSSAIYMQDL